jgi:calcineurin-like phosphoesterase family protein
MIFFTSDQHFGHTNILRYTSRPFESTEEMDEEMIKRWNAVVRPLDIVYHLGDFTLGAGAGDYLSRLRGTVRFVVPPFHHDKRWLENKPNFKNIEYLPAMWVEDIAGVWVHMCHYPVLVWDRKHYGSWNLYGHVHNKDFTLPGFSYNVGVDHNDFTPVSFDKIIDVMLHKGWSKDWREF